MERLRGKGSAANLHGRPSGRSHSVPARTSVAGPLPEPSGYNPIPMLDPLPNNSTASGKPPALQTLDYADGHKYGRSPKSPARVATTIILTLLLIPTHVWYTFDVAYSLWELWGGIQRSGRMTSFGGTDLAPTVPLHVPGGFVFYTAIKAKGLDAFRQNPHGGGFGVLLLLAGSIAAAFFATSLITAAVWRDRPIRGRYCWRLWEFLLGWGWILVPAEMSWVFQWTVVY